MNPKFTESLAQSVEQFFKEAPELPGQAKLKQQLHAALQKGVAQMDLVSREEFDIQQAVLLRTREKLDALEARVSALEANLER